MAFYSTQDYLAAEARRQQAQLRAQTRSAASGRGGTGTDAGAVQHPPEHERARMQDLLNSIPETRPGPNAFAIQVAMAEREKWEQRDRGKDKKKESKKESHAKEDRTPPQENQAKEEMVELDRRLFADRADRHREMLDAHDAYQRSVQRRRVSPLVDVHPAMRGRSYSDPPTPPQPDRDSTVTQLTQFINAGWNDTGEDEIQGEGQAQGEEPKLKLKATPNPDSVPTFRGRIEDMAEEGEGTEGERVPVFHPTPKMPAARDFAASTSASTSAMQRPGTPAASTEGGGLQKEVSGSKLPVKTPKKSIFSKFKLSTNSRASLSKDDEANQTQTHGEERLPVKAQAVLGESPRKSKGRVSLGASNNNSPTKLPRSPSKRKNFFSSVTRSSKNADVASELQQQRPQTSLSESQRPPNTPSTVVSDGPQTAISDPAHWSYQERVVSLQQARKKDGEKVKFDSDKTSGSAGVGLGLLGRSKSLKFIDPGGVPPTPPAKNTPPHVRNEREERELKEMQDGMKVPSQDHPEGNGSKARNDSVGTTSTNDDTTTPTRLGKLGYRAAPTLVTKPSMYSMHASVVPDLMEANYVEEMNALVGALDLEGFSMPGEGGLRRSNIAAAVYSPSVYADEWDLRGTFNAPGATPLLRVDERWAREQRGSAHTKDSSSNGTIPIVYPELASDPSVSNMMSSNANNDTSDDPDRGRSPQHLSPELTWHSRTHSRDHLEGDAQSIFAQHVDHHETQELGRRSRVYDSPGAFSHASAMVSPLHFLPATVYTPPTGKNEREKERREMFGERRGGARNREDEGGRGSGRGIQVESPSLRGRQKVGRASGFTIKDHSAASPTRGHDIFDTAPSLELNNPPIQASTSQPILSSSTHQRGRNGNTTNTTDPQKPRPPPLATDTAPAQPPLQSPTDMTEKFDQMLTLLTRLSSRGGDISDLQAEMRDMNRRLEGRLSAVERERGTPPLTPASTGEMGDSAVGYETEGTTITDGGDRGAVEVSRSRELGERVSTDVAHEFYRRGGLQESFASAVEHQDGGSDGGGSSVGEQMRGGAEAGGSASSGSVVGVGGSVTGNGSEGGESEALRELRETNRRLAEMMGGFAEKLRVMEERMGRDGGSASGSG